MGLKQDQYAKRTLDFVERLQKLERYEDICGHIATELQWFGFSCVSSWSVPGPGDEPADCILLNNRPKEYVDRYIEKNYVVRDPVVTELRKTLHPFTWNDVRTRRALSKSEKSIMDEARDFGARDGFIVPIVTLSGSVSLFSPCGLEPNLTQRARAAVEIIGMYSFHALKRAMINHERQSAAHTPLTAREREIMQWVAAGKSDDEIADILTLSAPTVTWHVENAKRKLDAFRRTYAVVQAIRFGEIAL
jgi:LuxR family transcriptional regulator, quorum-sensing system regulator BjaR1